MRRDLLEAELVHDIVGAFFKVYNYFGPGLPERIYAAALEFELTDRGHHVVRELSISLYYTRGRYVGRTRLDMVVDSRVIVENKASERLRIGFENQLINYLKASPFEVGLFLHYGPRPRFFRYIDYPKRPRNQIRSDSCNSCSENVMSTSDEESEPHEENSPQKPGTP